MLSTYLVPATTAGGNAGSVSVSALPAYRFEKVADGVGECGRGELRGHLLQLNMHKCLPNALLQLLSASFTPPSLRLPLFLWVTPARASLTRRWHLLCFFISFPACVHVSPRSSYSSFLSHVPRILSLCLAFSRICFVYLHKFPFSFDSYCALHPTTTRPLPDAAPPSIYFIVSID